MDFLNIKEQIKKKGYTYEGFGIEVGCQGVALIALLLVLKHLVLKCSVSLRIL